MVTIIMITVGQFSLMIVTTNIGDFVDDDTDTTDDNDLDGFKWIQDWYEVFFGVTVGQFFSDNLRLCTFIHHGKISPFGCTTVIVLIKHHRFHHMRLCCSNSHYCWQKIWSLLNIKILGINAMLSQFSSRIQCHNFEHQKESCWQIRGNGMIYREQCHNLSEFGYALLVSSLLSSSSPPP